MNIQQAQAKTREGNILLCDFMGIKFTPYKGNTSMNGVALTYQECETYINNMGKAGVGYKPEIGWTLGVGKFNSSWNELMKVVEKVNAHHKCGKENRDMLYTLHLLLGGGYFFTEYERQPLPMTLPNVFARCVEYVQFINSDSSLIISPSGK